MMNSSLAIMATNAAAHTRLYLGFYCSKWTLDSKHTKLTTGLTASRRRSFHATHSGEHGAHLLSLLATRLLPVHGQRTPRKNRSSVI